MKIELKTRNAQALAEITRKYKRRLKYFAECMISDNEWAEDFAGDSIMKLWERHDFDSEEEIKNFLYQTVRDSCLQYLRVYDRKLTDDQIQQFFYKAELLEELQ